MGARAFCFHPQVPFATIRGQRCTSLAATCPGASATGYVIAPMSTSSQGQQRSQQVKFGHDLIAGDLVN